MLFKVIDVSFVSLQPGIFFLNATTVGEIEYICMVKKYNPVLQNFQFYSLL